jgi:hypothetical protein
MANLIYDKLLSFGQADLTADSAFPEKLDLGAGLDGKSGTIIGRMTVDVFAKGAAGGTGLTVKVQGSADGATAWADLGTMTFTADDMKAGPCKTAVSPNDYRYIQVIFTKAGTFSAGTAEAFLNTYAGK